MLCYVKLLQSCLTLCDPIDGSPPGSTIPGILQARILEWVAISFSNAGALLCHLCLPSAGRMLIVNCLSNEGPHEFIRGFHLEELLSLIGGALSLRG